jgi:hypothetical protein
MVKSIVGVIVGYIVMVILQIAAFMTVYTVLGANWAFKPRAFQASTRWTLMQFCVILVTAVIAGFVCALISKSKKAPLALAAVVLVLGFVAGAAKAATQGPDPHDVRVEAPSNMDAMQKARNHTWVLFLGPVIGAVGVVIGGKLRRQS